MNHKYGPIVLSLSSTVLTEDEKDLLKHDNLGGILLFKHNYQDHNQLKELVKQIRIERAKVNKEILIMVDHEGGRVWRFGDFTKPQAPKYFGELYKNKQTQAQAIDEIKQAGRIIAAELIECGIDLTLAPVLDLDHNGISSVIGDRALSDNPNEVAALATAFIDGLKEAGMAGGTGKHFPGHGAIAADTHFELAEDGRDLATIQQKDLMAFEILIKNNHLSGIMPAHVIYKQIDNNPAGCSYKWLKEILRQQMGFNGVIISDCLSMKAIHKMQEYAKLNTAQLCEKFLAHGCDLIIYSWLSAFDAKILLENLKWTYTPEQEARIATLRSPELINDNKKSMIQRASLNLNG